MELIVFTNNGQTFMFKQVIDFKHTATGFTFTYKGVSTGVTRKATFNHTSVAGYALSDTDTSSELKETTPEIKSEELLPASAHIEGKDTNNISSKGEDPKPKFIKRQDRLYPTEYISAYDFFINNQYRLSYGNYPFNAKLFKSRASYLDRATHVFVLNDVAAHMNAEEKDVAHMTAEELEQIFLEPIELNKLTYMKLLYVTQDSEGNYEMVMDTSTDWDNPKYRGLEPELFE